MLHQSLYALLAIAAQLSLLVILARIVYLCYFHPLARYPGPFLARFTNLWFVSLSLSFSYTPPSGCIG